MGDLEMVKILHLPYLGLHIPVVGGSQCTV